MVKTQIKMRVNKYFIICFSALLLLSCFRNKNNNNVSELPVVGNQLNSEEATPHTLSGPPSIEEAKNIIQKNERRIIDRGVEIEFIERANFGIPGGDNWIVRLDDLIFIYAINGKGIDKRYYLTSFNLNEKESAFDIMRDIPGTHIGNSTSSFGDFNGDGKDEIFEYGFYGYAYVIKLWGYNEEKDKFVSYCEIPFRIIDREFGPAPIEFMTYNGMYGFKVRFFQSEVAGGPDYVYEPNPKNGKWIFYTWDEGQREYVEVGEVTEEE